MISVCMATYNGEQFIEKQLKSILPQLSINDEVVISDDSSTDSTITIIRSFKDSRIRLFAGNKFRSPIYNMENALKNVSGDYIFLSDQDDIWERNKVAVLSELLKSYDMVLSNCRVVNDKDEVLHPDYYRYYFRKNKPRLSFFTNLKKNPFLGCAMAFNRRVLNQALPFPKRIAMHDIWIGLLASVKYKVYFTEEILFSWRRHQNNVTFSVNLSDGKLTNNSFIYKVKYRLAILYLLVRRLYFERN